MTRSLICQLPLLLCGLLLLPGCADESATADASTDPGTESAVAAHSDPPSDPDPAALTDSADHPDSADPPEADGDASEEAAHAESGASGATQSPPAAAWTSWPVPSVGFVVTGEMHGYFEPCGCTANQLGGMGRRADLFRRLSDGGWTVRGIDVGGLPRRTGRQAQIKFDTTLAALRELRYVAVALGPEELQLDPSYLISQHLIEDQDSLRFLGANLVFYGTPEIGTPLPWSIIDVGGSKVGITAAMGKSVRSKVIPDRTPEEAAAADVAWKPAAEALPAVVEEFAAQQVDFQILLSQASLEESRELAKQFPSFDVLVTAEGFGEGEPQPEMIGTVRMLQVGRKGRSAGVLGLYPDDAENPIRFELISLTGEQFDDDPRMITLMQRYQDRLKSEQIVTAEDPLPHASGASFVGADTCAGCHEHAYQVWSETGHAHALESLDPQNKRLGHERLNGVNRMYDPECLSCHVTGWDPQEYVRFTSGFINREFAATDDEKTLQSLLAGNQCENCHGPGSRHVELIEADELDLARQQVRVTLEQARDHMCAKCHDLDNSPDFDFDSYWKKVEHYDPE